MQEKKQNISPIKQRILQFIDTLGISKREFYTQIGVSRGTLESKTGITEDIITKFITAYPTVSIEWLMTGYGEIYKTTKDFATTQTNKNNRQTLQRTNDSQKGIPLIPIEAIAGIPSMDDSGIFFSDCNKYIIPEFESKGVDYMIRVSGSSMYPKYSNGDILACKFIKDVLFLQWGKIYVIDSSQGALVKRVFQDESNPDNLILVSDNKDNYPPFTFPKSDIRSLSIVIGVIRLE